MGAECEELHAAAAAVSTAIDNNARRVAGVLIPMNDQLGGSSMEHGVAPWGLRARSRPAVLRDVR